MTEQDSKITGSKENENMPSLYSKNLIYLFSILFSTIFGAVLLMSNLKQVGNNRARLEVLIFGIIFMIGTAVTLTTVQLQTNLGIPLNILGALILNEFYWNRYIGKETEYEKKNWGKPALISVLIILPFVIALLYGG